MNKFIKFNPFGNNVLPIYDPTGSCSVVSYFDKVHGMFGRHILFLSWWWDKFTVQLMQDMGIVKKNNICLPNIPCTLSK
jgi:hypothetical protein